MDRLQVIADTERWVREIVVGLELCPFAARPLERGTIRYRVCEEADREGIYRGVLAEMVAFLSLPESEAETALFIVPRGLEDFDDYLDLLYALEEVMPEAGLEGVLQLASFHPDYLFEGASPDDPANYSNRSPWPMFHLIREDLLAEALARYPHPEEIPRRNIRTLRALGVEEIRRRAGFGRT
ncbi:MAG TPA: DUF1415 domain-containing protein [Sedimenticola sp.]|nr:DUF1415 domain-containing protein [Sedimenticola sp.]